MRKACPYRKWCRGWQQENVPNAAAAIADSARRGCGVTGRVCPCPIPPDQLSQAGLPPPAPGNNPENLHSSHIAFIPEEHHKKQRVIFAGFILLVCHGVLIYLKIAESGS